MSEKPKDSAKSLNPPEANPENQPNKESNPTTDKVPEKRKLPEVIYLKKDKDKEYPIRPANLDSVIVFQYRKEKLRGREYDVPASDVSAIGIYTQEQYDKHAAKGGLFDRLKLLHEVWHKPEDEDTIQE